MGDKEREADEERKGRGFTVVDRRGRAEEPEAETPPPSAGAGRTEARAEGPGFTLVGEPHGEEAGADELPPVDFAGLALSLATSALHHLGLIADPETGQPGRRDLRLARHTIDTLELLEDKTRGNLTDEEAELLAHLLTELRMRFVEASQKA